MTSAMTVTGVCNMALDILHEGPISSIEDDEPNARRFKRNFDALRDAFLAAHPWNFAVSRVSLPADATAPAFGWDYRYLIPGDCLRLLPLKCDGEFDGANIPHELESGFLLTDEKAPLKIRYVRRVSELGLWTPLSVTAFAAFLAANLAHAVTGKASYAQFAADRFQSELKRAKRVDGLQGSLERADTNDVIAVRG
ncbi:hypothetical protein [Hoeflea sp. TYP-13]|uniref:hypothetical protein n=1 Tax=Hoeflea sp. TYP-13 TaxID=3230023 RepID=UPI0034C6DAF5